MSDEQLANFYIEKLVGELKMKNVLTALSRQNLSNEQKKLVIERLEAVEKQLKMQKEIKEKKSQRIMGIVECIVSVVVVLIANKMSSKTSDFGFIYSFNIILYIIAAILLVKGIIDLIKSSMKD